MLTAQHLSDPYASKRDSIVSAFMNDAVFDGLSVKTLHNSFVHCHIPPEQSVLLFPDGVVDVLAWHSLRADEILTHFAQHSDLKSLSIRKRIETLLMHRFEVMANEREAIRKGLHYLSLPHHVKASTTLLFRTVDTIWRIAGDTSTDMNYYTKRMILSGIYTATLPIWLSDKTPDLEHTRTFLQKRLNDALKLGKLPSVFPKIENTILSVSGWLGNLKYK